MESRFKKNGIYLLKFIMTNIPDEIVFILYVTFQPNMIARDYNQNRVTNEA